jgi:aryl-alcohol dehydrogenase-like predicted oxidoreductase
MISPRAYVSGIPVSVVGLGCNNLGDRVDDVVGTAMVRAAVDAGITFFDTADVYAMGRSEEILGRALAPVRAEVVIATKFGRKMTGDPAGEGGSPAWARTAARASMRRLGTDYLDLFYLHTPDPSVPLEDTMGALHQLVLDGAVREVGISQVSVPQLEQTSVLADAHGMTRFTFVQNEYNLLNRAAETGVIPVCRGAGIHFVPYYPFASSALTGRAIGEIPPDSRLRRYPKLAESYLDERSVKIAARLQDMATRWGRSPAGLAMGFLLSRPEVTSVIAGASRVEHVRANAAAGVALLTTEEITELEELSR